jgi:hypothetical protein
MADCMTLRMVAREWVPSVKPSCCERCHCGVEDHRVTEGRFLHREVHLCCSMWDAAKQLVEASNGGY